MMILRNLHSHVRDLLIRLMGEIIRGTLLGIVLLLLMSLPISWLLIPSAIGVFEDLVWDGIAERASLQKSMMPPSTHAEGLPGIFIVHERYGEPVLAHQMLPGVPVGGSVNCELLHRLRVRKQFIAESTPAPREIESQTASDTSATPDVTASDKPQYEPDLLIVELCRTRNGSTWNSTIEIGYQAAPGQWQRIGWWRHNGIAASNELIRFEEDPYLPGLLRKISMPSTVESATAFISKELHKHLKELNADYKVDPRLSIKAREWEVGVASEINRILPEYTGSLASTWPVFMCLTISGGLQAGMVLVTIIAFLSLFFRWIMLNWLERRWLDKLRSMSPAPATRLVVRYNAQFHRTYGLWLPSLAGASAYANSGRSPHDLEQAKQQLKQMVEDNNKNNYLVIEAGKKAVYLGLLGTLAYLVWALLTMRIDPDPAKMQSILSITANTMSGAFLTTVASSTLLRLIEFAHSLIYHAEVRVCAEAAAWLDDLNAQLHDNVCKKQVRKRRSGRLQKIVSVPYKWTVSRAVAIGDQRTASRLLLINLHAWLGSRMLAFRREVKTLDVPQMIVFAAAFALCIIVLIYSCMHIAALT